MKVKVQSIRDFSTQEVELPDGPVWLFVYGTLRPGEYNHHRMGLRGITSVISNCEISGFKMWNVTNSPDPVYPVVKRSAKDYNVVVGDLIQMDTNDGRFQSIVGMELRAGYELAEVKVDTGDPEEPLVSAYMFLYRHSTDGLFRIKENTGNGSRADWCEFVKDK